MPAPSVTYTFVNGTAIDAGQVNTNFTDLINGLSDGTKDLSISALTVGGTATLNGHVNLGNSSADDLTITASLASTIPIKTTNSFNIGSATLGLGILYLGNGTNSNTVALRGGVTGSSYTLTLPTTAGTSRYIPETNGSGALTFRPQWRSPYATDNLGLSVTVASNIITVALKGADGNDPSSTNPVTINFRHATAATGTPVERELTAAHSLTLGTAVSLGAKTAVANEFIIYAFDDAGTITLGASLQHLDESTLQSSSTTGTSNAVIYQASAVTSKPARILGRFKATWTNAVGWSSITEVSVGEPDYRKLAFRGYLAAGHAVAQSTTTTVQIETVEWDTHNCFNTTTFKWTAPKTTKIRASGKVMYQSDTLSASLRYITIIALNTTTKAVAVFDQITPAATGRFGGGGTTQFEVTAGDTIELRTNTAHAITNTLETGTDSVYIDIEEI